MRQHVNSIRFEVVQIVVHGGVRHLQPGGGSIGRRTGRGWGALELVARLTQLEVDDGVFPVYADPASSATKATTWSAGADWHLNRNVKLSLQYDHTAFRAAAGNPLAASDEHVILTRIQFSF